MNFEKELEILRNAERSMIALRHASGVLIYDSETVAPEKSAEGRGRTLEYLGDLEYQLITGRELNDAIDTLQANSAELSEYEKREVELAAKQVRELSRIPKDEYLKNIVLQNEANQAWKKAKASGDFSIFEPYLEKEVEFTKKMAGWINPELSTYDALLNIYEEGIGQEFLDKFFADIKAGILPIIEKVKAVPQVDRTCIEKLCPADKQREFTKEICRLMGLDMKKLVLGEVEHPFTDGYNNSDIRLTTHYYEHDFTDNMFSILHEGGHSMYEMNCDDKYNFTIFQGGVSMGIHESQSRFYENIIGRSYAFTGVLLEAARKFFPEQLEGVTHDDFFKAVNRTEPSLIRIQADELTYALHIMVRYEIEKQLFEGDLKVHDAPKVWNDLYEEYLGIRPENDSVGILQDSHWSNGQFGYFPTYAVGSAYGAQYLHQMLQEKPDMWDDVAKGDLSFVTGWLKEHIQRHASYYKPDVLFENACGKFDAQYFIDYLNDKYTKVYDL